MKESALLDRMFNGDDIQAEPWMRWGSEPYGYHMDTFHMEGELQAGGIKCKGPEVNSHSKVNVAEIDRGREEWQGMWPDSSKGRFTSHRVWWAW